MIRFGASFLVAVLLHVTGGYYFVTRLPVQPLQLGVASQTIAYTAFPVATKKTPQPVLITKAVSPISAPVMLSEPRAIAAPQAITPAYPIEHANKPPIYPRIALRQGQSGTVVLDVHVLETGQPDIIYIKQSSGYSRLDRAAKKAVRYWTFSPKSKGTKRWGSWVEIPIVFRLTHAS